MGKVLLITSFLHRKKGTTMSLIGELSQSDSAYPDNTRWALEKTKLWLEGKRENGMDMHSFFRVLETMRHHTEFRPSHASNEPEPIVLGSRIAYREPVWQMIHEVAAKHAPDPTFSEAACAAWLQDLVAGAIKYDEVKASLQGLLRRLSGKGVSVATDSQDPAAISIKVDPELSGKNATGVLVKIVDELIPKLEAYIENEARAR